MRRLCRRRRWRKKTSSQASQAAAAATAQGWAEAKEDVVGLMMPGRYAAVQTKASAAAAAVAKAVAPRSMGPACLMRGGCWCCERGGGT